jgi:RNA polymerase-binding transcription factor DksA
MVISFLDNLFRERLLKRRQVVVLTLRYLAAEKKVVDQNREWKSACAAESRKRLLAVLRNGYEDELEKIESALARVGTKDYGRCRLCLKGIDRRRLKLFPAADLCFGCQKIQRHEQQTRREGKNSLLDPVNSDTASNQL